MSIKFVNALSKYIPAHFRIAPKQTWAYLDELLDYGQLNLTRYLEGSLTPNSTEIYYNADDGLDPFKDQGVVKIQDEYIKYNSIDRTEHKLYDLERGYFGTEATAHCNETLWAAKLKVDDPDTSIDSITTTIEFSSVTDITKIPKEGRFRIYTDSNDEEIITYTNFNPYINGYQFENVTRGAYPSTACVHPRDSYIEEYANLLIEQIDTVKYDKGLWLASLSADMTATDTEAAIEQPFIAQVASDVLTIDDTIFASFVVGTVPEKGFLKIGSEIIQYGYYEEDSSNPSAVTGVFRRCVRGRYETSVSPHSTGDPIYFSPGAYGEFLIDEEYIHFSEYDVDSNTFSGLTRGLYGTSAEEHDAAAVLQERRHAEFEPIGVLKAGKEYIKYWYVDDDYFYIDKRPALNAKTYYRTKGTNDLTSIIEGHEIGEVLYTYHFDDENSYLIDFLHTAAEHLDLATAAKIDLFEDFTDVDNVNNTYLPYLVKMLGEDLDDYQNLPFFTGTNSDYRIRLFTKELVNIYKQKGLLSALKLWHTVISEPLTNYQDLWTLNYCSFYSLPFLSLLLYEESRLFYSNNENFLRPQIDPMLQAEIADYYSAKTLRDPIVGVDHLISDLKLVVKEWEYLCKMDDDLVSDAGKSFDDRIVPCDSEDDEGVYYDRNNVELQVRSDPTATVPLPFFIEDYDVDLFKFEDDFDLPENKDIMPVFSETCIPATTDMGLVSDYESYWIQDDLTIGSYDYCDLADRLIPLSLDMDVLVDQTSDSGNAVIELDNNISATEDEIVVKVTNGKLYDPELHIQAGTNPAVPPKGFVKFGDEIISYTELEYCDSHDGTFANPNRYLLKGCTRGANNTTAVAYKVNLYEDNERLMNGKTITLVGTESGGSVGTFTYRIRLHRDPLGFGVAVGDIIHLVQTNGASGAYVITAVISSYDYCEKEYTYAIEFQTDDILNLTFLTYASTIQNDCTIDKDNSTIECEAHGLTDGDFVYFLESSGAIHAYQQYYVVNATADDFQIAEAWDSTIEPLSLMEVYNLSNIFLLWGTKILTVEEGYQHRYSMCQHIMWRLDNQVNGNDLALVYDMTEAQLSDVKLDTYKGLGGGVIWPTPHFKYGFTVDPAKHSDDFPPDEVIDLVLKKIKEYKPKHTVIDFTVGYPLDTETGQVAIRGITDTYETEYLTSDKYVIQQGTVSTTAPTRITIPNHDYKSGDIVYIEGNGFTSGSPYTVVYSTVDVFGLVEASTPGLGDAVTVTEVHPDEYHIEMRHDSTTLVPDQEWDLTIFQMDSPTDYGATAGFSYTWHDGQPDERTITYEDFEAYPDGYTMDVVERNRLRHLNYVDL